MPRSRHLPIALAMLAAVAAASGVVRAAEVPELLLQMGHGDKLNDADLHDTGGADGRYLVVSLGYDGEIKAWDGLKGTILGTWQWPVDHARPQRVVIARGGQSAVIWDDSSNEGRRLDLAGGAEPWGPGGRADTRLEDVCHTADRTLVAVLRRHRAPRVLQVGSMAEVGTAGAWEARATPKACAFSRDGRTLAVTESAGFVTFFDVEDGLQPIDRRKMPPLRDPGPGIQHPKRPAWWAFAHANRAVIWDAEARAPAASWERYPADFRFLRWSEDGERLIYGGHNGARQIIAVDPMSGEEAPGPLAGLGADAKRSDSTRWAEHLRGDGDVVVLTQRARASAEVWDLKAGRRLNVLEERPRFVTAVAFMSDSRHVALGTADGRVQVRDLLSGARLPQERRVSEEAITALAASGDGRLLAAADAKGFIRLVRRADGAVERELRFRDLPVGQLDFVAGKEGETLMVQGPRKGAAFLTVSGIELQLHKELKGRRVAADTGRRRLAWLVGNRLMAADEEHKWRVASFRKARQLQVSFSPDASELLVLRSNGTIERLDAESGALKVRHDSGGADLRAFSLAPDGRLLAAIDRLAVIHVWVGDEAEPRVRYFLDGRGDWLAWDPDGAFDYFGEGGRYVAWKVGGRVVPMAGFAEVYQVPGLLGVRLAGGGGARGVSRLTADWSPPPSVRILGEAARETDLARISVTVKAEDAGGGVSEVRLYHQERLVGAARPGSESGTGGRGGKRLGGGGGTGGHVFEVALEPGENVLVARAFSEGRIESRSAPVVITRTAAAAPVGLRVLSVGIDSYRDSALKLRYAKADADAVADAFTEGGAKLFTGGIEAKRLFDADATRAGILGGLDWLAGAARTSDVALVFVAAHGETVDGKYYLIPQDLRFSGLDAIAEQGIAQEELLERVRRIPARKVIVLLDTCKSGALAVSGLGSRGLAEKKALSVLGRASGVYLIAASTGQQEALENAELGHGVFSWALLTGLGGGADLDGDGAVSVRELVTFTESEVARLSLERFEREQFPVTHATGRNFPIALVR